jgi:Pvc16 N-terminal domain
VSNTLAITSVTAAFAQLLTRAITDSGVAGARVRLEPPDPGISLSNPLLNLYLYDVNPHPSFGAAEVPFRSRSGDVVRAPVLALNLHYLITAYGKGQAGSGGNQLEAQHLLGHAMSYVHDNATLTRAHVRQAITAFSGGSQPPYAPLAASDLDAQVELVKLTPLTMTPDEISKLWTAFNQVYRLSVAYEASVVLIQRRRAVKAAPPARSLGLLAVPIRRPRIESLSPQMLTVDDELTIAGRNLSSPEPVRVSFASGDARSEDVEVGDREILVEKLPAGLLAGPNAVRVVHQVRMGLPDAPGQPPPLHRGQDSNAGLFVLAPKITTPLTDTQGKPIKVARNASFKLQVAPSVRRAQQAALLLGGRVIEPPSRPAPPAPVPDPTNELTFGIPADQPTGLQLIQLRVDGAESALEIETDPAHAHFNEFIGPKVEVT